MPNQNQPWSIDAHDAEIVADQRAGDDQQRHPEQEIDQPMLALRLLAAGDGGSEKQRRADPGKPDPDDRRLDMNVAQEVEGQKSLMAMP